MSDFHIGIDYGMGDFTVIAYFEAGESSLLQVVEECRSMAADFCGMTPTLDAPAAVEHMSREQRDWVLWGKRPAAVNTTMLDRIAAMCKRDERQPTERERAYQRRVKIARIEADMKAAAATAPKQAPAGLLRVAPIPFGAVGG